MNDPNRHVRDYLSSFVQSPLASRHAVMLTGAWGSGKTRLVELLLSDLLPPIPRSWWPGGKGTGQRFRRVSLHGLKSQRDIDDALFAALYPWTTDDGVRIAASVGKAILKHAKIDLPTLTTDRLINRFSAEVFVFDDLERCEMKIREVFGYLNQFVERDGCKVIVLANEAEIRVAERDDYRREKEKLIGRSLAVTPDFGAAFRTFAAGLKASGSFLTEITDEIEEVYTQSRSSNLRILQQIMQDFDRVYIACSKNHRANRNGLTFLARFLFAISFELRGGHIAADDLVNRIEKAMKGIFDDKRDPSPLAVANARYAGLELYDSILPDDLLADILVRGSVDAQALEEALAQDYRFTTALEPPWQIVWHSFDKDDDELEAAAVAMQREFEARAYEITGELLHVFSQMLKLADLGLSGLDRLHTVDECKRYIDDLAAQDRLSPMGPHENDDIRYGSYGSLGFHDRESKEFGAVYSYLGQARRTAALARYPQQAADLLDLMEKDVDAFAASISNSEKFGTRPIFASTDASVVARRLIALDAPKFREAMIAFNNRYDNARLHNELRDEKSWASELFDAIMLGSDKLKPFGRTRVRGITEHALGKRLDLPPLEG